MTLGTLIDSGADESLMDWGLARMLNRRTERLSQPIQASALDGSPLFRIMHKTEKILAKIDHENNMSFHVFSAPLRSLVLGFPWLRKHNPHIDWHTGKVLGCGEGCTKDCVKACHNSDVSESIYTVSVSRTTDSVLPGLTSVPHCYHDLGEVFSKKKATSSAL